MYSSAQFELIHHQARLQKVPAYPAIRLLEVNQFIELCVNTAGRVHDEEVHFVSVRCWAGRRRADSSSESAHGNAFTPQLLPNFVCAIDLHVGLPDALDVRQEQLILLCTLTSQVRVALAGSMAPVA